MLPVFALSGECMGQLAVTPRLITPSQGKGVNMQMLLYVDVVDTQ